MIFLDAEGGLCSKGEPDGGSRLVAGRLTGHPRRAGRLCGLIELAVRHEVSVGIRGAL